MQALDPETVLARTDAPTDREPVVIDVASDPPPKPLTRTLETLADAEGVVLLQVNDRVPRHLFPKLDDRGYEYDSTDETGDGRVVTAIWRP